MLLPALLLAPLLAFSPVPWLGHSVRGDLDGGDPDAGLVTDAGVDLDAGPVDAGPVDAGPPAVDAGTDAGAPLDVDAGAPVDAGSVDAGPVDAGPLQASDGGGVPLADAGDINGNPDGETDTDPGQIPARCNQGDDCPLYYTCVAHRCQPPPRTNAASGCSDTGAAGSGLSLLGLGLLALRRRRRG
jgi:MYXO-CTERM domain-containing protein